MPVLSQEELAERLAYHRLLPAVTLHSPEHVRPLGQAFLDGGLPVIEVTYRTEIASEAIRILRRSFPDMIVGAGTILLPEQAEEALAAGASFMVSPNLNDQVAACCASRNVAHIPGVQTATEIGRAMENGTSLVKFFPAHAAGGTDTLKAMAGPFPTMRFMPTGGITDSNLAAYLDLPNVVGCGGTWFSPQKLMEQQRFDEITEIVAAAVNIVQALGAGR